MKFCVDKSSGYRKEYAIPERKEKHFIFTIVENERGYILFGLKMFFLYPDKFDPGFMLQALAVITDA